MKTVSGILLLAAFACIAVFGFAAMLSHTDGCAFAETAAACFGGGIPASVLNLHLGVFGGFSRAITGASILGLLLLALFVLGTSVFAAARAAGLIRVVAVRQMIRSAHMLEVPIRITFIHWFSARTLRAPTAILS